MIETSQNESSPTVLHITYRLEAAKQHVAGFCDDIWGYQAYERTTSPPNMVKALFHDSVWTALFSFSNIVLYKRSVPSAAVDVKTHKPSGEKVHP